MKKYKVDPKHAKETIYYINDGDHFPVITFKADGTFFIKDKSTTDTKELVAALLEVVMDISVRNGYATIIENECDCGGETCKTTHATWCKWHQRKK